MQLVSGGVGALAEDPRRRPQETSLRVLIPAFFVYLLPQQVTGQPSDARVPLGEAWFASTRLV
jgi:hypothetical protein